VALFPDESGFKKSFQNSYSGAAWATSGTLDRIEIITDWRRHPLKWLASEKVPSDICYDKDGWPSKWGFELSREDNNLRWVKLLLSPLSLTNMASSEENVVESTRM
jgi:hypothetical protein